MPDRDGVAVLGYDLWRNWFASSTDALGATVRINSIPFTVIGVAPASFGGMSANSSQIYIPTMMLRTGYRYCDVLADETCTILFDGRPAGARVHDGGGAGRIGDPSSGELGTRRRG